MNFKIIFLSLIAINLWGISYPLTKIGLLAFPPFFCAAIKLFFIATISLACPIPHQKDKKYIYLLSTTFYALTYSFITLALNHMSASVTAFIGEFEIPFAIIMSYIFFREKISKKQIMGMIISFLGLYIVLKSPEISKKNLNFVILVLIASVSYAASYIFIKKTKHTGILSLNVWSATIACPQLFLLSMIFETDKIFTNSNNSTIALGALFVSAMANLLAMCIWCKLIKSHNISKIVPFAILIPCSVLIFSFLMIGEKVHTMALFGGMLTTLGLWMQIKNYPQPTKIENMRR